MFYAGTLQEGISTAVSQQKLVLCFVTDGGDESQTWENELLKDDSIMKLIQNQAVALRLTAGSEEAGYLAQIFPLPKTPTIVLIKDGDLKEYITPGTTRDDFMRRIQAAFNKPSQPPAPAPASPPQAGNTSNTNLSSSPPQEQHSSNVQRVLADRAARLQAQKAESERKAKEDRARELKQAKAEAEAGLDTERARTLKQRELVKKKKQEEIEERKRILKRIEDDREERKSRASERQEARKLSTGEVAAALVNAPEEKLPSTTKIGEWTAIQVRLLDGTTLRSRFKTSSSGKELRQWVDEHRQDGNAPYRFKQILTPLPSRNIDETEEDKDLGSLQLAPSSTLVMVPVHAYASAYADESGGIFARIIAMILGFFTSLLGIFQFGGSEQSQPAPATSSPEEPLARVSSHENEEARKRRNNQLYNGNSTNFEPQPADVDDR